MGDNHYSFSLTMFSPSGKLVQIKYTLMAVVSSQTSLGIKAANGVVIATEKKLPSVLIDEESVQKIQLMTSNIGVVYSEMRPDFVSWLEKMEASTSILQVIDRNCWARSDGHRRGFLETHHQQIRSRRPVEVKEYSRYPTVDAPQERRPLSWYLPYHATIFSLITLGKSLLPSFPHQPSQNSLQFASETHEKTIEFSFMSKPRYLEQRRTTEQRATHLPPSPTFFVFLLSSDFVSIPGITPLALHKLLWHA